MISNNFQNSYLINYLIGTGAHIFFSEKMKEAHGSYILRKGADKEGIEITHILMNKDDDTYDYGDQKYLGQVPKEIFDIEGLSVTPLFEHFNTKGVIDGVSKIDGKDWLPDELPNADAWLYNLFGFPPFVNTVGFDKNKALFWVNELKINIRSLIFKQNTNVNTMLDLTSLSDFESKNTVSLDDVVKPKGSTWTLSEIPDAICWINFYYGNKYIEQSQKVTNKETVLHFLNIRQVNVKSFHYTKPLSKEIIIV